MKSVNFGDSLSRYLAEFIRSSYLNCCRAIEATVAKYCSVLSTIRSVLSLVDAGCSQYGLPSKS